MRKFATLALLFPVLLATTSPVGSQTRPRRVSETANNNTTTLARADETRTNETTLARVDERPRVSRDASSALEHPRRERTGGGNSWLRGLLGMGIQMSTARVGRSSCSPPRGVFLGMPRSARY